jgi:hypothetical protein
VNPTKHLSCDKQVSGLKKIVHSLATRRLRIVLQKAKEKFPTVRERTVSVPYLGAQTRLLLFVCIKPSNITLVRRESLKKAAGV